eukprot:SAG22_NODE_1005_length_6077_cov_3.132653_3_plen_74_part_00
MSVVILSSSGYCVGHGDPGYSSSLTLPACEVLAVLLQLLSCRLSPRLVVKVDGGAGGNLDKLVVAHSVAPSAS